MELIKREGYISKIQPFIDQSLIKVIIGQRRVGKSYILLQLIALIEENNPEVNIIYINKERYEFDAIKTYQDLIDYVNAKIKENAKNYLFIDEIQDIDEFERALRRIALMVNGVISLIGFYVLFLTLLLLSKIVKFVED